MKKSKFSDIFCIRCLSHEVVKLRSGKFSCLNCGDKWFEGRQKSRSENLEREVASYIYENQGSGVDLLKAQGHYIRLKRERRKRRGN